MILLAFGVSGVESGHFRAMQLKVQNARMGNVMVLRCHGRIVTGEEVKALEIEVDKLMLETKQAVLNMEQVIFLTALGLARSFGSLGWRCHRGDMVLCATLRLPFFRCSNPQICTGFFRRTRRKGRRCGHFAAISGFAGGDFRAAGASGVRAQVHRCAGVHERSFEARRI